MIRKATEGELSRIAEIFVFNNRINYFPIFKSEEYSFGELQVVSMIDHYFGKEEVLENLYVADECGIVKGFMEKFETTTSQRKNGCLMGQPLCMVVLLN